MTSQSDRGGSGVPLRGREKMNPPRFSRVSFWQCGNIGHSISPRLSWTSFALVGKASFAFHLALRKAFMPSGRVASRIGNLCYSEPEFVFAVPHRSQRQYVHYSEQDQEQCSLLKTIWIKIFCRLNKMPLAGRGGIMIGKLIDEVLDQWSCPY